MYMYRFVHCRQMYLLEVPKGVHVHMYLADVHVHMYLAGSCISCSACSQESMRLACVNAVLAVHCNESS